MHAILLVPKLLSAVKTDSAFPNSRGSRQLLCYDSSQTPQKKIAKNESKSIVFGDFQNKKEFTNILQRIIPSIMPRLMKISRGRAKKCWSLRQYFRTSGRKANPWVPSILLERGSGTSRFAPSKVTFDAIAEERSNPTPFPESGSGEGSGGCRVYGRSVLIIPLPQL